MKNFKRYFKVWLLMSKNSFVGVLYSKLALAIFLSGKVLRFIFFFAFLYFLLKGSQGLAGYNPNQIIFFFLTFNLVDILAQFLFREVYRFRPLIISGDFDLVLVKPINALFRSLMGGADLMDLITIPPLIFAVWYVGRLLAPTFLHSVFFLLLLLNGLIVATAFHIAVLAFAVTTMEIDHMIMIYRDLTNLGRFPVEIYKQPLQTILTYFIPVGIMITFPAKALMGLLSVSGILISLLVGVTAMFVALRFWSYALKRYSSASS